MGTRQNPMIHQSRMEKKNERPASNRARHTRRLTQRCSQAAACKINITRANFQARPFPPGLLQTRNTDVRRPRFSQRLVFLLRERGSGCEWNSIFFFFRLPPPPPPPSPPPPPPLPLPLPRRRRSPRSILVFLFSAPRYYAACASAVFVIARPSNRAREGKIQQMDRIRRDQGHSTLPSALSREPLSRVTISVTQRSGRADLKVS